MEINFTREWEYVPEWNDNKKNPKPVKVHLRYLSTEEKNSCFEKDMSLVDDKKKVTVNTKDESLFRLSVVGIDNLSVNKKDVTNADGLLKAPGTSGLYQEIVSAIWNREAELEREIKNSL